MNPVVAEWVEKAEADYGTAVREMVARPKPNLDATCYHAQQAIEKLMKGLLIAKGVMPPRTHNLVALHELIVGAVPACNCALAGLRVPVVGGSPVSLSRRVRHRSRCQGSVGRRRSSEAGVAEID